jgi:hypothetical protein
MLDLRNVNGLDAYDVCFALDYHGLKVKRLIVRLSGLYLEISDGKFPVKVMEVVRHALLRKTEEEDEDEEDDEGDEDDVDEEEEGDGNY